MSSITILGAGFAGLTAIRTLRKYNPDVTITLVAPRAELHFLPSTIWIPSGLRRREDVVVPLDNFLRRMKVRFVQAQATGLSDDGRVVLTDASGDDASIRSDGLIIASGGRFIKKLPGIEHAITPCEGVAAAEKIRDRLKAMTGGTIAIGFAGNPNEPSAMRGGPMFEFAFGIDRQLRAEGRRDKFEIVFFSPAAEPGNRLGPDAVKRLLGEMQQRGFKTHLGHPMKGLTADRVMTAGGEFAADLILFQPGMTGNLWFDQTKLPRSPGGLVQADAHCKVPGFERVYVAGDSGSFPGPDWLPKQAHMADLQAEAAAKNLLADLGHPGLTPDHAFKIELMCIVDDGATGMLVTRDLDGGRTLPRTKLMHWAKRGFEQWYLRKYR